MTSMAPALNRRTPDYLIVVATVLACIPILAIAQFAAMARVDDIDAVLFAYYGRRIAMGDRLYVDLWDNKPPGIFWIDAIGLWFSAGKYAGIVVVCTLATVGSCVLFFLTSRRWYGLKVAAIGATMAALYINIYHYRVGSNRPSTFYVFFELAILYFYTRSFDRSCSARRNRMAAGICAVGAVCFRQTALAVAAAVSIHQVYLVVSQRQTFSELVRTIRPMVMGAIGAGVGVVGLLWVSSDLGAAWHAVVVSNLGYVTESKQSRLVPTLYGWRDHEAVLALPAMLAAASVVYAVAVRIRRAPEHSNQQVAAPESAPPCVFALLVAWLPVATYLALVGPHRALHYYGIALPPLVMLATHGVWLLLRDDPARAPRFMPILAVLWFVHMALPVGKLQLHSAMGAYNQRFDDRYVDRYGTTVDTILAHTGPNDPVYTMRYLPWVFWRTNRPVAHRYILDTLIDQWNERSQPYVDEVIADLKASPPKVIVASSADMKDMEHPRPSTPITYRDLASWIRSHYTPITEPRGTDVWVRND